jgi:hypothetical protein
MRTCRLRAGLTKAAGISDVTLGNPKSWLGIAYHNVLEKIASVDLERDSIESAICRLWKDAVEKQFAINALHTLDRRFGPPETWPGYYLCYASVSLRANELLLKRETSRLQGQPSWNGGAKAIREQRFSGFGGRLVGKPDVIRYPEIIDYKTGGIIEWNDANQADSIKAGYIRQLRIYGFLVNESLGWWPTTGILLPPVGPGAHLDLEPDACTVEATDAVALLDEYNAELQRSTSVRSLASPSASTCKWCQFKLVCSPFWEAVRPDWAAQLESAVVEGIVQDVPTSIHGGAAVSLSISVERGTQETETLHIAPLDPETHFFANLPTLNDRIRVVGLRVRQDGGLAPSKQTTIAKNAELPSLMIQTAAN